MVTGMVPTLLRVACLLMAHFKYNISLNHSEVISSMLNFPVPQRVCGTANQNNMQRIHVFFKQSFAYFLGAFFGNISAPFCTSLLVAGQIWLGKIPNGIKLGS